MKPEIKWTSCLQQIHKQLTSDYKERGERMYNTWFAPVTLHHYDEEQNVVTLSVPNSFVYEALEQFFMRPLSLALQGHYGKGVQLRYKVGKDPDFGDVAQYLRQQNKQTQHGRQEIKIPDARQRIEEGIRHCLGDNKAMQWLQDYDKVVGWLSDNKGKGLLVYGTPGLGKTLLCRDVLPVILTANGYRVTTVDASELHSRLDELLKERIVVIDDLGKEPRKHYGNIDQSFFELCNNAERTGNLLIVTTNLSAIPVNNPLYPDSIERRYGSEVLDRLKVITRGFCIEGKSMRS